MSEQTSCAPDIAHFPPSGGPLLPGVMLSFAIGIAAMVAVMLIGIPFFTPLILAVTGGLVLGNLIPTSGTLAPGIAFTQKRLLRLGIVLLGLQVTVAQVQALGAGVLLLVLVTIASTFVFIILAGRFLRVDPGLTALIAVGTSVCGASAVIAANAVTRAKDEYVAYAIACVTVVGTVAMFLLPALSSLLGFDAHAFGIWSGAAVHEVAQVAAVSFQHSNAAVEAATVTKLLRVTLLAPLIMLMAFSARARIPTTASSSLPMPWFVLAFAVLVLLNSFVSLPAALLNTARIATTVLLASALAAMGLNTKLSALIACGTRPALLALLGAAFIAATTAALIRLLEI